MMLLRRAARRALLPTYLIAAVACGQAPEPDAFEPTIPADWVGYDLGLAAPTIEEIANPVFVAPEDRHEELVLTDVADRGFDAGREDGDDSWTYYRMDTQKAYRVRFDPAQLQVLYDEMVRRGETAGFRPDVDDLTPEQREEGPRDIELPPGAIAGWSNGIDSRVRLGIADGKGVNWWPYRAIGHLTAGEGCTATLIGRRTVLTAAHCVASQGVGVVTGNTFRARSDNTTSPMQLAPYGSASIVSVWVPSSYVSGTTCGDTSYNGQVFCNRYDIAVAELSANIGNQTGGFGYGYAGAGTLNAYAFYLRGYPSCKSSWADRPNNCPGGSAPTRNAALWGQSFSCGIDEYWAPDGDGWNREFNLSCDGSRGMSGSAGYTYDSPINPGNPIAFGVYSQFLCTAASCSGTTHASDMTRITPSYAGMMVAYKSIWGG